MKIKKINKGKPYLLTDVQKWGGKGDNLLKLAEVFQVPQGFVISSDTYQEFVQENGLNQAIAVAMEQGNPEKAYEDIKEKFAQAEFSEGLVSRLQQEFEKLEKPIAVRSSSINEDGNKNSFAGQHESVLGVPDFGQFLDAIKEVYASLYTPRAINYRQSQKQPRQNDSSSIFDRFTGFFKSRGTGKSSQQQTQNPIQGDSIAVVAQQMINPTVSGVAYSPSPSNLNEILIESSWGLCTSVVDGRTCDIYRVKDTVTGNSDKDISPKKEHMEVFDPEQGKLITKSVPHHKKGEPSLTDEQVLEVAKTVKSVERAYGCPMDMEFAYDENGQLYVLQARPITGIQQNEQEIELPNIPQSRILVESKNTRNQGIFEGPVVVVRGVDHVNRSFDIDGDLVELNQRYSDGYILLSPEVPPQLEQHVTNAKAMYATECGTTGHAAAIAVEKGIIYLGRGVSNIQNLLASVRSGDELGIAVSGDKGILYRR
jgi:pyruvate,water dikinase